MKLKLCDAKSLDIVKTFECGQCFRWNANDKGVYTGVVGRYLAEVETVDNEVYITSDPPADMCADYFDHAIDHAPLSADLTD